MNNGRSEMREKGAGAFVLVCWGEGKLLILAYFKAISVTPLD